MTVPSVGWVERSATHRIELALGLLSSSSPAQPAPPLVRHEAEVARRFDALQSRFKPQVSAQDYRLQAILRALVPLQGRRILDLGCGKGRFGAHLQAAGAEVIGLDRSAGMLAEAAGQPRVLASAYRLPFAAGCFDAAIAIEVFEHLARFDQVIGELRRVVRPGGAVAIVDKNVGALDARRPWLPSVAVKRIDERRGRWMYPSGGPVRERWFWPSALRARLEGLGFESVRVERLLSPSEACWPVFRRVPRVRLMTLWSAKVPGGPRG